MEVLNPPGYNVPFTIYVILIIMIIIAFTTYRTVTIKKQLKSVKPRISICLNECVISIADGNIVVNSQNLDILMKIAKISKLYLIAQLPNHITEDQLKQSIHREGSNILKHRIMSCSTATGRGSMVRQLQPILHVEVDKTIVEYLNGKVANVMYLEENNNSYDLTNLLELVPLCKF